MKVHGKSPPPGSAYDSDNSSSPPSPHHNSASSPPSQQNSNNHNNNLHQQQQQQQQNTSPTHILPDISSDEGNVPRWPPHLHHQQHTKQVRKNSVKSEVSANFEPFFWSFRKFHNLNSSNSSSNSKVKTCTIFGLN